MIQRHYQVLPVILSAMMFLSACGDRQQATGTPVFQTALPSANQMCTSFCLKDGDHCVFGTNMDHRIFREGQVFVNKRHVMKTAWESSTSGQYARWISRFGSVTFNIIGSQLVWAGMNEAGLMLSTMSLIETQEPAPDERPPLLLPLWGQYQLDNHSTIDEVIASDDLVRVTSAYDHFLVCDRSGACAVIEFLDGEMVVYSEDNLPIQALTNSTYQDSLDALKDGEYWKIEVIGVIPGGPADAAGFLEGDWITAVEGSELGGEKSLDAYYSIIADYQAGDELTFSVTRKGESGSVQLVLEMAALPEDTSMYVLPPGAPLQIISLGMITVHPGDFLSRFATVVEWLAASESAGSKESILYAFDMLEAVSRDDTRWSLVFDPVELRAYFRSDQNTSIRYLDLDDLDFSCGDPAMMLDIHAAGAGDISHSLVEYSHEMALDHAVSAATQISQADVSPLHVETILTGTESYACMEANADAMTDPGLYVQNHPPLLPPLLVWGGLMVVRHLWPVWLGLCVVSLVILLRRLTPGRARAAWILVTIMLGPIGLLVFLMVNRRSRLVGGFHQEC